MKRNLAFVLVSFGSLAVATSAATGVNLVVNPGADAGAGGNGTEVVAAPGWAGTNNPTVTRWSIGGGYPVATDPGPPDRGSNFFSGGLAASPSLQTQLIDVSDEAVVIDSGVMGFSLGGYLGGFASQDDNASLRAEFLDGTSSIIGTSVVQGPLAAERSSLTGLFLRSAGGTVPLGTRSVRLAIIFTRLAGTFNDGYADSITFTLVPLASCVGDFNGDMAVNTADLVRFLGRFGQSVPAGTPEDLNADGAVNTLDLTRFLGRFGQPCP